MKHDHGSWLFRSRSRVLSTVGAMLLATIAATCCLPGEASAKSVNHSFRDYLKPETAHASSSGQCGKPVGERSGPWFCGARNSSLEVRAKRALRIADDETQYCPPPASSGDPQGCWAVGDDKISTYGTAEGVYGFDTEFIGYGLVVYDVTLNGAQSVSNPVYFESTADISSITLEGERLYYSAEYPGGNGVNGGDSYNFITGGPQAAGDHFQWLPNGYKAYENTVAHGGVVHQATWTVDGYPGNWYIYVKTPIFDMTSSSYRFTTPQNLGTDPIGAGYHLVD